MRLLSGLAIVLIVVLTVVGCGSKPSASSAAPNDARLRQLTKLYATYLSSHQESPPASAQEFRQFVAEKGEALLNSAGVSSVDELFVSPRDGKPYMIRYGKEAAAMIGRGVVAYEQAGVDGRRMVGFRMGFVRELDEPEFRELNLVAAPSGA